MSQYDLPNLWSILRGNLSEFASIPDRTHQGFLNHLLLVKLMKGAFLNDPNVIYNGTSVLDPTRVYYWGISQGGIMVRPRRHGGRRFVNDR